VFHTPRKAKLRWDDASVEARKTSRQTTESTAARASCPAYATRGANSRVESASGINGNGYWAERAVAIFAPEN